MTKLDDLFAEDDSGALTVPSPDDDIVTEIAGAEGYVNNDIPNTSDVHDERPQTGKPGDSVECRICGNKVGVKRDGYLRVHKCEPKPQRGNRLETLPERKSPMKSRTRDFSVNMIAWCVEESTAHVLARPFGADPSDVPTELPDSDVMVGIPLDMVWPEIPKAAQQFLDKLADNADVIECGIAWYEWMRTVGKWTREQREINRQRLGMNNETNAPGTTGGQLVPFIPASEG